MTNRFPTWIRPRWAVTEAFDATQGVLREFGLHSVCQSARCPNRGDCWGRRTAAFMMLGDVCTRRCAFCAVKSGSIEPPDRAESWRVAEAVQSLDLAYVVITSVTRDDLDDGGAGHFANTVTAIRSLNPETHIEVLVPDFQGNRESVARVMEARPDVFGHNIETVARLHPVLRDTRYNYRRSLDVLRMAADLAPASVVKSGFMVGHGETEAEVRETLEDLRAAGCAAVSIGQYLQPSPRQRRVAEFIEPERFAAYERLALELGFAFAVAGPLVRSSYRAQEMWFATIARQQQPGGMAAPRR